MNVDSLADSLADRRALRRKLSFWRALAIVAAILMLLIAFWRLTRAGEGGAYFGSQIARISIGGLITGDDETLKLLDRVREDKAVKAVVLSIESPGGTTTGAERLFASIRKLAAVKPVVADVRGMAASGAYIAALGSDHIVAQGTSLVGSIGVLFEFPNVSKLLSTVGVQMEEIKSTPLKAAPDGMTPTSPQATAAIQSLVADSYSWFKDLVQERRHITPDELAAIDDGRIFTGRQALGLKLIDQLGEESDAVAWLEAQKGVSKSLPVRDWRVPQSGGFRLFSSAAATAASALGFPQLAEIFDRAGALHDSLVLDGLLSIWQADQAH